MYNFFLEVPESDNGLRHVKQKKRKKNPVPSPDVTMEEVIKGSPVIINNGLTCSAKNRQY